MVTRRFVLAGLAAGFAEGALAEPLTRSLIPKARPRDFLRRGAPGVERLLAEAGISGKVGFAVADARTGALLETHNPLLQLPPASTAKAITAAYARAALGGGHRFQTQVAVTGKLSNGRLNGDLILVGGGDPTLDTEALAGLASAMKAAGLREVSGRFLYYESALPTQRHIDETQPPHVGYNPAVSGLNLNYNRVHFEWRKAAKGWNISMDARAGNYRPGVAMSKMKIAQRSYPVYTYADQGGVDRWTVAAGALGRDGSRWLPVRKPGLYTAEVFGTLARSHGIVLKSPKRVATMPQGARGLVAIQSAPLDEILRGMLKYSTNITAEAVGMAASTALGRKPGGLKHSGRAMSDWAQSSLDAGRASFVDHSGLGAASRISAGEMVRALVAMGPGHPVRGLMKDIELRDDAGQPLFGGALKVNAKTGTLNFVSALAGFVRAPDGRELAFATLTADTKRRDNIPPEQAERPEGARGWTRRSRNLQFALIDRWARVYA
ncbi:D-alanyl-D-alanine carboxypeptidase [Actibacterium mucosum KCTC 23349]|uniref:D-alanyl-D-alanine carboxypeptidase n=1 Tax=Actibacterium mucosum KCTC 23349 TaxID=1454373 RepID=A0A037ZJ29_9RHOB|nr:D-alanyl-D-alanine carboxypeptidase/D-alanyl-D-alanine-endopeptidase [Actibacterium mucosum]KAJ56400.1 D-alanyl-D-alanine carboxypeptidase [Actibacterium mucosum KCTC 23349]